MPSRRRLLLGIGTSFVGAGALLGTGAFSSVNAERTVAVNTVNDADALLGIEPGAEGGEYVIENGTVEIDITGTNAGGQGVNVNAITAVDQLLEVTNNGTTDVAVGFSAQYAEGNNEFDRSGRTWDRAPYGWTYAVNNDEDAALAFWASPNESNMDDTYEEVRPGLSTTGFGGSKLISGSTVRDEVGDTYNGGTNGNGRVVGPGESINIGLVVDTRDSTVVDETIPSELDDGITIVAEATGTSGGNGGGGSSGGSGGTNSLVDKLDNDEDVTLQSDYDASSLSYSDTPDEYTGTLDGNGQAIKSIDVDGTGTGSETGFIDKLASGGEIKNLTVEDSTIKGDDTTGFIGLVEGDVTDVTLTNVTVEGKSEVGTLAGENNGGTIQNATAGGSVSGTGNLVGGLAGYNSGTIEDSSASGTVEGDENVGGFVGQNSDKDTGKIKNSYATGSVTGYSNIGGFAGSQTADTGRGQDRGLIEKSYATGSVTGGDGTGRFFDPSAVGGFVGKNNSGGTISESYATGAITTSNAPPNTEKVGGFVGNNAGTVKSSYATGSVTGDDSVGGFAGENGNLVSRVYATGNVTGNTNVGGLVGRLRGSSNQPRDGILRDSYFDKSSTGTEQSDAVGVIAPFGNTAEKRGEVTGLETTEMQGSTATQNMSTFDFGGTWTTVTSPDDYPILGWE